MEKDLYPFALWYNEAMLSIIKKTLTTLASHGLTNNHSFYIVFKTNEPQADIPEHLRIKYPNEMTIVLEHDFWDLRVDNELFAVTLAFNGIHERLRIPWKNIVGFFDPSINYAIQLHDIDTHTSSNSTNQQIYKSDDSTSKKDESSAIIVNLSDFRKPTS